MDRQGTLAQPDSEPSGSESSEPVAQDLDDFAYVASHDLKEPLRGISAYCEILLEDYYDKLDREGQRRLGAILAMCNRLGGMIDSLMTYCRVGRVPSAQVPVDLDEVVAVVIGILGPMIEKRKASVRVVGKLPTAAADRNLLGMVFGNLVANGLKFNESAVPSVEIGLREGTPPVVYVRDNGIGIAAEHHDAVFTLFRRLHSQKKYEGTGAGLTIARKIVQSYGGEIWVESKPGRGSTFLFTLGSAMGPAPAVAVPEGTQAPSRAANPPHWAGPSKAAACPRPRQRAASSSPSSA